MHDFTPLKRIEDQFARLPGIGRKTARRLAFHILKTPPHEVEHFADEVREARASVGVCRVCGMLSEGDTCPVCADARRDAGVICVVSDAKEVFAVENTHEYRGVYHVLGGVLSPLHGVEPEDLSIAQLVSRVKSGDVKEVILATNPDVSGEATAAYIADELKSVPGVRLTRIAHGVPIGSELEYADAVTLSRAISGRRPLDGG